MPSSYDVAMRIQITHVHRFTKAGQFTMMLIGGAIGSGAALLAYLRTQ
jgi:hypothetical protein